MRVQSRVSSAALFLAVVGSAATATAQAPPPNLLLLVDTSGSMEQKADGSGFPICAPGDPTPGANETSRWIDLVQVLTGSVVDYSCWAQDRSSEEFKKEYTLVNNAADQLEIPYDTGYLNPYHRMLSGTAPDVTTPGPNALPPDNKPYLFPSCAIGNFPVVLSGLDDILVDHDSLVDPCAAPFSQEQNGLLDSYRSLVRFAFMSFDSKTKPGTGMTPEGDIPTGALDLNSGVNGLWSYYDFTGNSVTGRPTNCTKDAAHEVGCRNSVAPPWEGRLVSFGDPDTGSTLAAESRNAEIQSILLAMRPYGATPIDGMMNDARHFLWEDDRDDPRDSNISFGPWGNGTNSDEDAKSECRATHIILLSDGEPNLSMRPACEIALPTPPGTRIDVPDGGVVEPYAVSCIHDICDQTDSTARD